MKSVMKNFRRMIYVFLNDLPKYGSLPVVLGTATSVATLRILEISGPFKNM
jgi:hypothetical protein